MSLECECRNADDLWKDGDHDSHYDRDTERHSRSKCEVITIVKILLLLPSVMIIMILRLLLMILMLHCSCRWCLTSWFASALRLSSRSSHVLLFSGDILSSLLMLEIISLLFNHPFSPLSTFRSVPELLKGTLDMSNINGALFRTKKRKMEELKRRGGLKEEWLLRLLWREPKDAPVLSSSSWPSSSSSSLSIPLSNQKEKNWRNYRTVSHERFQFTSDSSV